ncbi:TPA: hypothetical protein ACUMWI_001841 [Haemophilus influenzae]|uniref:Uncharacterized protein n=1 Tax=Haemophilus influenzae TaxID=727 RepID=A0ABD6WWA9_HAEIF|nr:hypothetical protein [Haemophilus influenzae]EDK06917.1 hypothetical protein CGSHiAA_00095 [Haemophilus influenzae PittAA]MCK8823256.1 hypothetical protein [Haemophilus influenzae]MCK8964239.1 hypothetical protein [Haemophilus influenzae]MCK8991108.1 hypothetical protein [Haemophilus influenzae]MCK8993730.1 hypothetical protein [Haemophilus influenzae]
MRDFIQFWTKLFFVMLIALGSLLLLFSVDFAYILAFFSVFLVVFGIRLAVMIIQTNKYYDELKKAEKEKARVKYVIIN